jgi:sugar lactone lactonase YvrE
VQKVSSVSGQLLASIAVPGVLNVTSCAFGGDLLQDLYITSAQQESPPKQGYSETNAGDLFKIHLSDCQGLPAYQYLG